jgi:hypothetical protein
VNKIAALLGTSLTLVGLYLILRNFLGASRILDALASGTVSIFRVLQGR